MVVNFGNFNRLERKPQQEKERKLEMTAECGVILWL
jgi:hypothetical protein